MKEFKVNNIENNKRLDKYLQTVLNAPFGFVCKLIRKKNVKVNGVKQNEFYTVKPNDLVQVYGIDEPQKDGNILPKKEVSPVKKEPIKNVQKLKYTFNVLFEDKNILIVSKPSGLLTVPDEDKGTNTLYHQVLIYLADKGEYTLEDAFVPHPAHRIDRNTSGIVIIGKTQSALDDLEAMFKNRTGIEKKYLGLVVGSVNHSGVIDKKLEKNEKTKTVKVSKFGETAITEYNVIENFGENFTLLEFNLITGRTHQIRVHTKSIDHPIVGDSKYGNFKVNHAFQKKFKWKDQFLHAYKVKFSNIVGDLSYLNGLEITDLLPKENEMVLNNLRINSDLY